MTKMVDRVTGGIKVGDKLPRRGNRFTRGLAILFMALIGWRISGYLPNLEKFIIIGVPHTSNWDFVLFVATATSLGVRLSWMGKHSLFKGPMGPVFRWMGGVPIDRRASGGMVGGSVAVFEKKPKFIVCITPEGTRSKVSKWKSGFYQIALGAKIPILLAAFDYEHKVLGLGPLVEPTGDYEKDLECIKAHYAPIKGKHLDKV